MKKFLQYLLVIFFLLLLVIPIHWLLSGDTSEVSTAEARTMVALAPAENPNLQRAISLFREGNITEAAEILLNLYTSRSFIEKFERATSDQFPLRMEMIQFSRAFDRFVINISYALTQDKVIPADMTNDIYYDKVDNQLLHPLTLFNQTTKENIDTRIQNYTELIQENPELNFYLYYHQLLENSDFHPINIHFSEADRGQSFRYFEGQMPDALNYEKFLLTGMEDHLKYYYRTDHHWNVYGVLRAYDEIYELLRKGYPEISPKLENEGIMAFPEIDFLGRMARITFFPIDGDDFAVELIDIPEHQIIKSGQELEEHSRQIYYEGNYSTIPYINHFNEFYGKVTDLIEYSFDNNSDRNLLMIGSSYRIALDPLLASHYNKTYCIDLRYNTDFSLSEFLEDHKVDDILIIGDNTVAFDDIEYWKINP